MAPSYMLRVLKRVQIYDVFFYHANIFQKKLISLYHYFNPNARNMLTLITNGQVLTSQGWRKNFDILFDQDRIILISEHIDRSDCDQIIDAEGKYIIPGGIDLHVHGGGGHDFLEGTEEAFSKAIEAHQRHGTTAIYPTLAAASIDTILQAAKITEKLMNYPHSPIMGLHLECPYLNPEMAGAQNKEHITNPRKEEYMEILSQTNCIKRWDAAPELEGALEFGHYISSCGIIAAVAHTKARYNTIKAASEAGYNFATHFYNAMTGVHKCREYKHEGTIESIYLMDDMNVEVIADGIHVPPAILRMIYKFKGVERTCLVTDAMGCTASDTTTLYDPRVIIEDGVCKLSDRSALAGSIATMDRLIQTMVLEAEIPLKDAVRMSSETPAKIMGIYHKKGSLEEGKDPDIVMLNHDLQVEDVWCMGRRVRR